MHQTEVGGSEGVEVAPQIGFVLKRRFEIVGKGRPQVLNVAELHATLHLLRGAGGNILGDEFLLSDGLAMQLSVGPVTNRTTHTSVDTVKFCHNAFVFASVAVAAAISTEFRPFLTRVVCEIRCKDTNNF